MVIRKQNLPFLQELLSREDVFAVDLDDPFGNIGCVIMASGLGKRFGGNKLMANFHGKPMISRILDATDGIFAQRVVVTRSEDVASLCKDRGIRTVLHDLPHRSDTVRLGLEAMDGIDRCMFTTADQPLLRRDTVAALALASANDPDSIWRTIFDGTPGSPVAFPQWAFPELENLPEGKGGGVVVQRHIHEVYRVSVSNPFELADVDTPEMLTMLEGFCHD
jgi:molybdenum cofactor cytidylyltransferase